MTLGQMTDMICRKVGKNDTSLVKDYIRTRYQMIWDQCVWRDSQFVTWVAATKLAINNDLAAPQYLLAPLCELILPSQVGQVLGIRYGIGGSTGRRLEPCEATSLFGLDASSFTELGDIVGFTELESSATRNVVGGKTLRFSSSSENDVGILVEIEGNLVDDGDSLLIQSTNRRRETLVLNGTDPVETVNEYTFIYAISKPPTTGTVTALEQTVNSWMVELYPEETSRKYIHLMVHRAPGLYSPPTNPEGGTFFILAKRQFYNLRDDASSSVIRGIDNALMAFATADYWERMRQFSKMQLKIQEGERLLAQRMVLERESSGVIQIAPNIDQQYECLYS